MPLPAPSAFGPRVQLVFPRRGDQRQFIELSRASRSFHRGWASPPSTAQQFARFHARARDAGCASLLIRRIADNQILGAIEISHIVHGPFRSAYLGYQIGAPFARQGYMTEALGLALAYAFVSLRLHRLEANIQPTNVASRALVRRLGFTREGYSPRYLKIAGRWRDHERWAILAEDWRRRHRKASSRQPSNNR